MNNIFITGVAGFIGYHTALSLLKQGKKVVGIDTLNEYYDIQLKLDRIKVLHEYPAFTFLIIDVKFIKTLLHLHKPDCIIHLAAQPGVRYSLDNPEAYIEANVNGFLSVLEACRSYSIKHLIYASSSSVYGLNHNIEYSVSDKTDEPVSLYAATKKMNELMASSYQHLFHIPLTGLRFFTVYGPWGRPDMFIFKCTKALFNNESIDVYNNGHMERDFTYIDDIVQGITSLIPRIPNKHTIYNFGNNNPEQLMNVIAELEKETNKKAIIQFKDMQPGDVFRTAANIDRSIFNPTTSLSHGISQFVQWYKNYYGVE